MKIRMNKTLLDAVEIVMEELRDRLPRSSKEGYMPTKDVVAAIEIVNKEVKAQKKFNKNAGSLST